MLNFQVTNIGDHKVQITKDFNFLATAKTVLWLNVGTTLEKVSWHYHCGSCFISFVIPVLADCRLFQPTHFLEEYWYLDQNTISKICTLWNGLVGWDFALRIGRFLVQTPFDAWSDSGICLWRLPVMFRLK